MSVLIVFICHDDASVEHVIHYGYPILFVGDKETLYRDNVIMVRELADHIEHLPKFLTFTAWYAIVKNKLFLGYEHLCLLEWDVVLEESFVSNLTSLCRKHKAISFVEVGAFGLWVDVNKQVFSEFLKQKGCDIHSIRSWGSTSNQCLSRDVLVSFVDWYYPSCLWILQEDPKQTSWYHERLYMVYLADQKIPFALCDGLIHYYKDSHKTFNKIT